ncbi:helix-turn-helix domain-containing protein [Anaerocolumna sp. AGMB13020]|uniref:helix-turn-helix domain-containing protein n=1 Tax=Anaerocolumna sp. AGMB13020 TaxID=3081750 RepID=UPI002953A24F|nr:helix-turn-helix domain-containing protein [Anaerocolumna sp. AGMB13020]WOO35868.1 helix-turn-helix domain-containing protein [Anaerocolumna sp. AGMB13020]
MKRHQETVEAVKKYIESNIDDAVSPDDAAKEVNYSLRQLNRIFSFSTGITVSEYIRWRKLVKSLFELKYSERPVIDIAVKFGYESQESYTRAFKENFALNPGEYRKTKQQVRAKNWHINQFIHQSAHSALNEGLFRFGNVDNWIIVKPDRIFISARRNTENLPPGKFYDICMEEGIMSKIGSLPNVITICGAYFPSKDNSGLCFGAEVEGNYPIELLREFEIIHVPQSKYVVFNYPKYPIENHGDAIYSTWHAQKKYDYTAQGLQWNLKKMPVFENDDDELGYILFFPASDMSVENESV